MVEHGYGDAMVEAPVETGTAVSELGYDSIGKWCHTLMTASSELYQAVGVGFGGTWMGQWKEGRKGGRVWGDDRCFSSREGTTARDDLAPPPSYC